MENRVDWASRVDLDWDDSHVFPTRIYPDVAFLLQRMGEIAIAEVEVSPGEVILDVGCGRAIDALELAKRGGRCLGLEPSRKMLEHARGYLAPSGLEVGLVRGISESLPFKSRAFDKVICKGALDHFPDPVRAIEEMARVLRPGGKAIIAVANFESLGFRLGRLFHSLVKVFAGRKSELKDFWQTPDDHTSRFDYSLLRKLVGLHLKIESATGSSLLVGLPGWSYLLDKLPARISQALLRIQEKLAGRLPSLSNVVIVTCRSKTAFLP